MDGTPLMIIEYSYLGVQLHQVIMTTTDICSKIACTAPHISRIPMYKQFVLPSTILEYSSPICIWDPPHQKYISKLEMV